MNIYDLYKDLKLVDIEEFISNSQEENLNLEFKCISKSDLSDKNDRRNFAKCLSGFANSNGGLIVWGIDASKNSSGIDCAKDMKQIDNLSFFMSKLNNLTGEFVSPVVDGVLHKKIEIENNKGIVLSLVPESYSGPHMAKAGEDRYYKRSGDSFYRMEHFDLEDMFGRRKKPVLELFTTLVKSGTKGSMQNQIKCFRCIIGISNIGRGLAKYPYLALRINKPFELSEYGVDGNRNFGLQEIATNKKVNEEFKQFGSNGDIVIHPGVKLEVVFLKIEIPGMSLDDLDSSVLTDLKIEYVLSAEGISLKEGVYQLTAQEIVALAFKQERKII